MSKKKNQIFHIKQIRHRIFHANLWLCLSKCPVFSLYLCSTVFILIIIILIIIVIMNKFDSVFLACCFFVSFYSRLNTKLFLSFSFSFSFLKYVLSVCNFQENKQKKKKSNITSAHDNHEHIEVWEDSTFYSFLFSIPFSQPAASTLNSNTIFHFNGLIHCWKLFERNNKINQNWMNEWMNVLSISITWLHIFC